MLGLLFFINISIAAYNILFAFLIINLIIHLIRYKPVLSLPPYFKYLLVFSVATLIASIFGIDRLNSLTDNKELFSLLLIPILLIILNSKKRLQLSLAVILTSTLIGAFRGVIQVIQTGVTTDFRLKGFTSHWMTFSGLLMLTAIFFFVYLFYENKITIKLGLAAATLFLLGMIALSLTRSAYLGLAVALPAFLIYYRPKILLVVIPAVFIVFLLLPQSVINRAKSTFDPNNDTIKDRIYMFHAAKNIFKDYPLTGVGPDNIKTVYADYKHPNDQLNQGHLHNVLLNILAERGLLGLVSMLLTLTAIFWFILKKTKTPDPYHKIISIAVLFTYIGFLIAGVGEYNFGDSEIRFTLFYFISLPFLPCFNQQQ
jgi:O-antigen ligase